MAGERLAKLTTRASWSRNNDERANQTQEVRFRLVGVWYVYQRGAYPSRDQFVVPDPADAGYRDYVKVGLTNLIELVKTGISRRGLPYTVSDARDAGDDLITGLPRFDFDIEATLYNEQYDLDFFSVYAGSPPGWEVAANLSTLKPVVVVALITPATIYGSASVKPSFSSAFKMHSIPKSSTISTSMTPSTPRWRPSWRWRKPTPEKPASSTPKRKLSC